MRLVLQRVSKASVEVDSRPLVEIGPGILALAGVEVGDTAEDLRKAALKVATVRLFDDGDGKMNLDLAAVGGAVLAVSQFTLLAGLDRGRRPGFERAMKPPESAHMFDAFVAALAELGVEVQTGQFGAHMKVALINDGPVTVVYDTRGGG